MLYPQQHPLGRSERHPDISSPGSFHQVLPSVERQDSAMAGQEFAREKHDALGSTHDHVDGSSTGKEEAPDQSSLANAMSEEEFAAHKKSLVRKLDYTLVPMVWLVYLFNYLDRNNIA